MSRPTDGLGFGSSDTYSSPVCHHILLIGPGASKRQDAIKQECWAESLVVPVEKEKPLSELPTSAVCSAHRTPYWTYIIDSGEAENRTESQKQKTPARKKGSPSRLLQVVQQHLKPDGS